VKQILPSFRDVETEVRRSTQTRLLITDIRVVVKKAESQTPASDLLDQNSGLGRGWPGILLLFNHPQVTVFNNHPHLGATRSLGDHNAGSPT